MLPPRRVPDALMYRYTSSGVIAHTVVAGPETIRAFRAAGWSVLIDEQEIRWADLETTRELDIARFNDWRTAWKDAGL